jgi:hypothetical protein
VDQLLQVVGALLILVAFILAQFNRLEPRSYPYLWLNAVGSGILAWLAFADRQWGFVLLEGTWALVSLWGLAAKRWSRNAAP